MITLASGIGVVMMEAKVEINNEYIALDFPDFLDFSGFNKIRKIWKTHHTICNFSLVISHVQSTHNETIA